jgi:hypothetical protein
MINFEVFRENKALFDQIVVIFDRRVPNMSDKKE